MNKVLLIALVALASCLVHKDSMFLQFQEFMIKYGKHYKSMDEMEVRFQIFKRNLASLDKNAKWEQGVTKFSDLTPEEFSRMLNYKKPAKAFPVHQKRSHINPDPPENFNWAEKVWTKVKDQKDCASCWAFSACGAIEGAYWVKHEDQLSCSEQNLIDCDTFDSGCQGGDMTSAFMFAMLNGGLEKEEDYPYEGKDGECREEWDKLWFKLRSSWQSAYPDEEELKADLYEMGPVSIAINAKPLQSYKGGIIDTPDCDPETLNLGAVLVGYGVENGTKFWIVRNSMGENWGEKGYFRVVRGKGMCGINEQIAGAGVE